MLGILWIWDNIILTPLLIYWEIKTQEGPAEADSFSSLASFSRLVALHVNKDGLELVIKLRILNCSNDMQM